MPKRGARWVLEPNAPCPKCGTPVPWMRNLQSGERLMARGAQLHRTADDRRCSAWHDQQAEEQRRAADQA